MKMKLAGLLFGALLASTSLFAANGSCGAGKCGGESKKEMKGSSSAAKCGAEHKKEMNGSCGAGKCGGEMKNDMSKMNNDMKDMKKRYETRHQRFLWKWKMWF